MTYKTGYTAFGSIGDDGNGFKKSRTERIY